MSQLSFQYKALDRTGSKTSGVIRALNQNDAYRQIMAAGLRPLRISAKRKRNSGQRKKINAKDLAHFTYQFSVLMEARIPVAEGLRSIAEQESDDELRTVIEDIANQIESGQTVTESMSPHRDLFGDVYIETVRAAEQSGNMVRVLAHLAEMTEKQAETTRQVRGALIYPACVVVALVLAVTFLVVFVVPKFTGMYASRGFDLPLPTQIIMWVSDTVRAWWWLMPGGGMVGYFAFRRALADRKFRHRVDGWLHRIPFVRKVLIGLAVSRFAHVFGLCLHSGLGLLDALEMSGRASARPLMQHDAEKMKEQVNHGGRLADVLLACSYLPAFARRMIAAGEEAAELPRMCEIVARHYDRDVEHLTRNVTTIIEPILIAGLAGIVLIVALAIFLPMWNMAALIQ